MYDELVKRLKNCATQAAPCLTCDMTDDGSCIETLMKQAADAIEELAGITDRLKWIPVTERLPEMHDEVLICNDDYGKTGLGFATVAVWDGSDWVNSWDKEGTICCVTHWMPLPQPPKEE